MSIMLRCCTILVLACVPIAVIAAPVPKEDDAARIRRAYGETIDPDRDCKFEMPSEKLRLTIPGKPHFVERKLCNAPRVAREIEGDFTLSVRVTFPIRPAKGLEAHQADSAIASAGLIAWSDDDGGEMVWILRAEFPTNGEQQQGFLSNRVKPKVNEYHNLYGLNLKPTEAAYLRLQRKGTKVAPTYSCDGKEWYPTFEVDIGWGKRVKVGMIAENGYKVPFVATFDEYKLEQPK